MIDSMFYTVLNMTLTASFIGFIVIILRKIKHFPRLGVYCLWTLVLLRLVIPFSVSSRTCSVINTYNKNLRRAFE